MKSRCWCGCFFGGSWENLCAGLLEFLEKECTPWLLASPSHHSNLCLCLHGFSLPGILLPPSGKDACDYVGHSRIVQGGPHCKTLNLITPAKSLWDNRVTGCRAGTWASLWWSLLGPTWASTQCQTSARGGRLGAESHVLLVTTP